MFDNKFGDDSMYHSKDDKGDKGVVINFLSPVQYVDVLLHTRRACCTDRYKNVCLYADNVKLGCTAANFGAAPALINFKDLTSSNAVVIAREYRIMFEDAQSAQIEELYVKYFEVDSTTTTPTQNGKIEKKKLKLILVKMSCRNVLVQILLLIQTNI